MADNPDLTEALDTLLFSNVVNDRAEHGAPAPAATMFDLFGESSDDILSEVEEEIEDALDLDAPVEDINLDDEDILPPLEPAEGDFSPQLLERPTQSRDGLDRALAALSAAQAPLTYRELSEYVSRGQHNSNIDPYGDRLRSTVRALIRRRA